MTDHIDRLESLAHELTKFVRVVGKRKKGVSFAKLKAAILDCAFGQNEGARRLLEVALNEEDHAYFMKLINAFQKVLTKEARP